MGNRLWNRSVKMLLRSSFAPSLMCVLPRVRLFALFSFDFSFFFCFQLCVRLFSFVSKEYSTLCTSNRIPLGVEQSRDVHEASLARTKGRVPPSTIFSLLFLFVSLVESVKQQTWKIKSMLQSSAIVEADSGGDKNDHFVEQQSGEFLSFPFFFILFSSISSRLLFFSFFF